MGELIGVPSAAVPKIWPKVEGFIAKALDHGFGDETIDDIRAGLERRDMQLWAWIDGAEITAALVTAIITTPRHRIARVPYIGGDHFMRHAASCADVLARWARERGCDQMEGGGRRGWRRLPSWRNAKEIAVYRIELEGHDAA